MPFLTNITLDYSIIQLEMDQVFLKITKIGGNNAATFHCNPSRCRPWGAKTIAITVRVKKIAFQNLSDRYAANRGRC